MAERRPKEDFFTDLDTNDKGIPDPDSTELTSRSQSRSANLGAISGHKYREAEALDERIQHDNRGPTSNENRSGKETRKGSKKRKRDSRRASINGQLSWLQEMDGPPQDLNLPSSAVRTYYSGFVKVSLRNTSQNVPLQMSSPEARIIHLNEEYSYHACIQADIRLLTKPGGQICKQKV